MIERERHAHVRDGNLSYPVRAIRTRDYLYVRNFRPDRWPAGDPRLVFAVGPFGDIDGSPTKSLLIDRQNDPAIAKYFRLATAKRPAHELYDLRNDPHQIENVAGRPAYHAAERRLRQQLDASESVRRKCGDGRCPEVAIFAAIVRRELPWPDVGHRFATRCQLVAPRISISIDTAFCIVGSAMANLSTPAGLVKDGSEQSWRRIPSTMRAFLILCACAAAGAHTVAQPPSTAITLFEGARLIAGDGQAPIERSAFVVENGKFLRVGTQGDVRAPAGAARIDLTGKTVIPALVDAHSHIGYMKDLTSGPQNYTRDNILDHLRRFAYFGVAASQAMGSDFGELPFQLREESHVDAARFLTAGRGLAPLAEIGAENMRHAAYAITTEQGARAAVEELSRRGVNLIKTWVDDRGGTIKKLSPPLYRAIIDEAHRRNMRVAVHATQLEDAKDVLRSGADVLAHMISDVDDDLIALFKQHPNTAVLTALGGPRRIVHAPWLNPPHALIRETVSPAQIRRLQDRLAKTTAEEMERGRRTWIRLARTVATLNAAGVKIGVGTDGGGQTGDQFIGWTMHTEMENLVAAGMTPAQVIDAATRTSAEILGLSDLGMVAAGKSADFVILDANPLDDITRTRRISGVYLRGRAIDRLRLRAGFGATALER